MYIQEALLNEDDNIYFYNHENVVLIIYFVLFRM